MSSRGRITIREPLQSPPYYVAVASGLVVLDQFHVRYGDGWKRKRVMKTVPDLRLATPFRDINNCEYAGSAAVKMFHSSAEYYAILVPAVAESKGPFFINFPTGFLVYEKRQSYVNPRARIVHDRRVSTNFRHATPFDTLEEAFEIAESFMPEFSPNKRDWYCILARPGYKDD